MQLGVIRERATSDLAPSIDRVLALVDAGIRSIRSVTTNLRPPLLDDLGLLPALRALVLSFAEQSGLDIAFEAPPQLPPVSPDTGLALFRALQETLSNVARHSGATSATVRLAADNGELTLIVRDNGRGFSHQTSNARSSYGLAGMRERISAVHGSVAVASDAGALVTVRVPLTNAGHAGH
jgi:signal transduction histidine kinase